MNRCTSDLHERLKRSSLLRHLLDVYRTSLDDKPHDVPIWEHWLAQSRELPPDFDRLPSVAGLPDVLRLSGGGRVSSPDEWPERRAEILELLRYYQLGSWPPPPEGLRAVETATEQDEALGCTRTRLILFFAPTREAIERVGDWSDMETFRFAYLQAELWIPPGDGPFPALVAPGYERTAPSRPLAELAVAKGYIVCGFDLTQAFACRAVYPDCDCNQLVWWAWAGSRCVDYLCSLDKVDKARIAVGGHSRLGKMSVICAALDERVSATIASHTGSGSGMTEPWRYMGEKYGGETLEAGTRLYPYWNHPRLRFFAGRENKLPLDAHFQLALIAPRALLITEGDRDSVGEPWGAQQSYLATKEVYRLLGHEERLNIVFHPGGHRLDRGVLESYVGWLDMQLGRAPLKVTEDLMYSYTFDAWREVTGEAVDVRTFPERGLDDLLLGSENQKITTPAAWATKREEIKERVLWTLGELPSYDQPKAIALAPEVQYDGVYRFKTEGGLVTERLPIDEKLVCHLTHCAESKGKLSVVIYCHAYQDQRGFAWSRGYGWGTSVGEHLAARGFLAVEFDQFGYGTRNRDCGLDFFVQHPQQSALGVMVQDVRRIMDVLGNVDIADAERIMVIGYALGGAVALHAAALDERIRAVASVCGFGSMRLDAHGEATEGLRRYSHLRPTLPRLGFFVGQEKRVPYDYHELLALIAPRPVFILAPLLDQDWFPEDVSICYERAKDVYRLLGQAEALEIRRPNDFNRYPPEYQEQVNDWLWRQAQA